VAGDTCDDFRLSWPVAFEGSAKWPVENEKVSDQIGEDRAIDGEAKYGFGGREHGR
jgi:hypothetical protein